MVIEHPQKRRTAGTRPGAARMGSLRGRAGLYPNPPAVARGTRPAQVEHPALPEVRRVMAAVPEDARVVAASILQRICEDGHERVIRGVADDPGEVEDHR